MSLARLVLCLCGSAALLAEQRPRIIAPVANGRIRPLAHTSLGAISASPSTISFTATDPSLGSVPGSSAATVNWTTSSGASNRTWTLQVQAAATSFTNCATVPTSAVTVTCGSVTGGTAGACGPAVTLSTTGQQVASGAEVSGANDPYSVTLSFSLTDSWSYIAEQSPSCTLTITYTVDAP